MTLVYSLHHPGSQREENIKPSLICPFAPIKIRALLLGRSLSRPFCPVIELIRQGSPEQLFSNLLAAGRAC